MSILEQVSVEEILTQLGISFEEKGSTFIACCPFHSDKTPSFSIYKSSGFYNCFGCSEKGSIYDLVYKLTNQSIYDFLSLEKKPFYKIATPKEVKNKQLKNTVFEVNGGFEDVFSNQYVLDYCWSIGLTNDFIQHFNVVYSKSIQINPTDTPLAKKRTYYNRLIIPCYFNNKLYNYELRDFTKKSSKKVLYPSGSESDFLFNYDNIDKSKTVYIVEGIKALSKVWSCYSKNVVSTFGKVIKENQKKLIMQLPYICVIPDNDENKINKKTNKPVDNIQETLDVFDEFYPNEYEVAYIPYKGKDPDDLSRSQLTEVLNNKRLAKDIIIDRAWPTLEENYFVSLLK